MQPKKNYDYINNISIYTVNDTIKYTNHLRI